MNSRPAFAYSLCLLVVVLAPGEFTATAAERAGATAPVAAAGRSDGTIDGTAIETFTDSDGFYRITGLPSGTARLQVFYTGLPAVHVDVAVNAGSIAQRDLVLGAEGAAGVGGGVVKLSEFVVESSRQM